MKSSSIESPSSITNILHCDERGKKMTLPHVAICELVSFLPPKYIQPTEYFIRLVTSKHKALNQCWFNVGPASQTVG